MDPLLEKLLQTTTVSGLTDVIVEIQKCRHAWKPVGDNDNNLAIINLGP